jgi:hypothetical protein
MEMFNKRREFMKKIFSIVMMLLLMASISYAEENCEWSSNTHGTGLGTGMGDTVAEATGIANTNSTVNAAHEMILNVIANIECKEGCEPSLIDIKMGEFIVMGNPVKGSGPNGDWYVLSGRAEYTAKYGCVPEEQ